MNKKIRCVKGPARNNVGFPDRIIFNQEIGEIHYVELKADTAYKQTIPQQRWQKHIQNSGGKYFLINGEGALIAYIDRYIKGDKKSVR